MAVSVRGKPVRLDVVWRPVWFVLLGGAGLLGSAWLAWVGQWWTMPLPFVGAIVLHQLVFWLRGDRPVTATLDGTTLVIEDRKGGSGRTLDLSEARHAGLSVRPDSAGDQAFLVLHDDARALLALRLRTAHRTWPDHAVDLDALQPVLGGNAGILRGLAPGDRIVRQTLQDPEGTFAEALLQALPEPVWSGATLRVWRGEDPDVDYMGLHQGVPDALLHVGPDGWRLADRLTGEVRTGPLDASRGGRAERRLALMPIPGMDQERITRLPLLVWHLADGLDLVVPSPIAGHQGEPVALDEQALHTHLAEGAMLVWWLLDHLAAGAIPEGVAQAIRDSRVAVEHPHPVLRRHLGG